MSGSVLLLGGSGFIGQKMMESLFAERRILLADRVAPKGPLRKGVTYLPIDFTTEQDFSRFLPEVELVVHLVSTVQPAEGTANLGGEIADNLLPTVRLLDAMACMGTPKLLFLSSGGTVYGQGARFPLREDQAAQPVCAYAAHKLAIETYLRLYQLYHGLNYRVVRLANPYSFEPFYEKKQGAVPIFIDLMRSGKPVSVWGDGEQRRDYIHIDDAMRGIAAVLEYQGPERVFNLGTGISTSLNELIAIIAAELSIQPDVRYEAARGCDVHRNQLDISLLTACTGWTPSIPQREGIRMCLEVNHGLA